MTKSLALILLFLAALPGCLISNDPSSDDRGSSINGPGPHGNADPYGAFKRLPGATDPVKVTSTISDIAKIPLPGVFPETGEVAPLSLGKWESLPWAPPMSQALCEAGQIVRTSFAEIAQSDRALCYVQRMVDHEAISFPYDGSPHDYELIVPTNRTSWLFRVKGMKIDNRFSVELSSGYRGPEGTATTQLTLEESAGQLTMIVNTNGATSLQFDQRAIVEGEVDDEGKWRKKRMVHQGAGHLVNSYDGFDQNFEFNQDASRLFITGFFRYRKSDEVLIRNVGTLMIFAPMPQFGVGAGISIARSRAFHAYNGTQTNSLGMGGWNASGNSDNNLAPKAVEFLRGIDLERYSNVPKIRLELDPLIPESVQRVRVDGPESARLLEGLAACDRLYSITRTTEAIDLCQRAAPLP